MLQDERKEPVVDRFDRGGPAHFVSKHRLFRSLWNVSVNPPLTACRHYTVYSLAGGRGVVADELPGSAGAPDREEFMHKPVRKAVFPVAGLGTRFLPATKAMPKEMLPIVDKPLIDYAVEEAKAAGIEQFFFVTSRAKSAIDDHFDRAFELEATLLERGKTELLAELEARLPEPGQIAYTRQQTPLGLGHAVWCARGLVGDEPFAVLLADDLMVCDTPCLAQMVEAYGKTGGNLAAIIEVPRAHTSRYGVLDVVSDEGRLVRARGVVEKPDPAEAPSTS